MNCLQGLQNTCRITQPGCGRCNPKVELITVIALSLLGISLIVGSQFLKHPPVAIETLKYAGFATLAIDLLLVLRLIVTHCAQKRKQPETQISSRHVVKQHVENEQIETRHLEDEVVDHFPITQDPKKTAAEEGNEIHLKTFQEFFESNQKSIQERGKLDFAADELNVGKLTKFFSLPGFYKGQLKDGSPFVCLTYMRQRELMGSDVGFPEKGCFLFILKDGNWDVICFEPNVIRFNINSEDDIKKLNSLLNKKTAIFIDHSSTGGALWKVATSIQPVQFH